MERLHPDAAKAAARTARIEYRFGWARKVGFAHCNSCVIIGSRRCPFYHIRDGNDATHFDFDRARLQPAGHDAMNHLFERLHALNPGYGMGRYGVVTGIDLVGHTDNIGSHSYNDRLGQRRAAAVQAYLESRGIPGTSIRVTSRGKRAPVASNDTEAGRAQNRRTEIIVHMVTVPGWR